MSAAHTRTGKLVAKSTSRAEPESQDALTIATPTRTRSSRLPTTIHFPLVAILSLSISSLSYSLLGEWSKGEIAAVSKSLDTWQELVLFFGWRILELAVGWYGNFDSLDLAALNVLSHGPPLYLLATFYDVSLWTALSGLAIDVLSTFIPFQLLRPMSGAHAGAPSVPNREIIADVPVQIYTTALSAVIYSVTLLVAYQTYLPGVLVVNFEGLHSLTPAYAATYASVLPATILFGLAAKTFIFTPSEGTGVQAEDAKLKQFDPVAASLSETFFYNLWGYTGKTKVAIARTVVAAAVTGINTYMQCALTIGGVDPAGASSYAAVWSTAALLTGTALGLVGRT